MNYLKPKRNLDKYKCIRIENISKLLSHQMIFSMFSQYGQIIAIMLSEEFSNINYDLVYNFVFIEFLTNSHAMNCKKMANKTLISKNSIRIKLTKYEKIYEVEDFEEDVGEIITYKDKDYLQRPIFSSDKTPERALTSHQPSEY